MSKHDEYAEMGLRALRRAAAKVAEDARKNNYKISIWQDGRVVYIVPDIIREKDDNADTDHSGSGD